MKIFLSKRRLFTLLFAGIFILGLYYTHHNFATIFKVFNVSPDEVSSALSNLPTECKIIKECKLEEGDILIRRYITQRTWLFDKLANPFFTHSAMYLGTNKIIEAVGYEKDSKNEIIISNLSESDWQDLRVESWVIIRARNISSKMHQVKKDLEIIANDPEYKFGLPKIGEKRLSCSDLILNPLIAEGIIEDNSRPKIITPDYLFWLAVNNPESFEIVGHSFSYQP